MFNKLKKKVIDNFVQSEAFKKSALEFAFTQQRKPKNFDKLQKIFIDSNGMSYYQYADLADAPVMRLWHIRRLIHIYQRKITKDEMKILVSNMQRIINRSIKQGENKFGENMAALQLTLNEIQKREQAIMHGELEYDLMAAVNIREDEDPSIVDMTIEDEKIAQFKKDAAGGLADFFTKAHLSDYMPSLRGLESRYEALLPLAVQVMEASNQYLEKLASEKN